MRLSPQLSTFSAGSTSLELVPETTIAESTRNASPSKNMRMHFGYPRCSK
jgi:hypothetical protein